MAEEFETYLKEIKFDKYLKKLEKKLKDKTVIIYGSGSLFNYISENYSLASLNIIGISDMKFDESQEGKEYLNYKIIPKSKIQTYKPDYVLVATFNYIDIVEDLKLNQFYKSKTKVYPLFRISFWNLIRQIWGI